MNSPTDRTQWLGALIPILNDGIFAPRGAPIPELRIEVGLPHARNQRLIQAQLFRAEQTADHIPQIFISPLMTETRAVLFAVYNTLCGLVDRDPISTEEESTVWEHALQAIPEVLGPYPAASLLLPELKNQTTRMLLIKCPACHWSARTTQIHISKGLPTCQCGVRLVVTGKK